jgi:ABC-type siderophore export system fused ATPase/permease subunit
MDTIVLNKCEYYNLKKEYDDLVEYKKKIEAKRLKANQYYRDKYANNVEYRKEKKKKNNEFHRKRKQVAINK